jgi:small ligand-binding sensory domain FIST
VTASPARGRPAEWPPSTLGGRDSVTPVRWASSISDARDLETALELACNELHTQLDAAQPDLLVAFVSREHQARWPQLPDRLRERWPNVALIGCSAGGVIADGRELEGRAGLALTAAVLPGVELTPFHLADAALAGSGLDAEALRRHWSNALGLGEGPDPHLVLLPDPFTWPGPDLLAELDRAFPTGIKIGGLASGGDRPGEHRLFCRSMAHPRGMVGVAMRGNLEIDAVVAQGCRPIGQPMFVTRHQRNVIAELDGRPALEALQTLFDGLDAEDRARARHSLFIGVVVGRGRGALDLHGHGDFLIRNLVGVDPLSGSVAIAAVLDDHAVVQFHLRDAETSAAELRDLLDDHARVHAEDDPAQAALLFSCLGRGAALYGQSDHDSLAIRERLAGPLAIAGFFCNGEIGPIAGRTFVHGYTSAIALIRPATMI